MVNWALNFEIINLSPTTYLSNKLKNMTGTIRLNLLFSIYRKYEI